MGRTHLRTWTKSRITIGPYNRSAISQMNHHTQPATYEDLPEIIRYARRTAFLYYLFLEYCQGGLNQVSLFMWLHPFVSVFCKITVFISSPFPLASGDQSPRTLPPIPLPPSSIYPVLDPTPFRTLSPVFVRIYRIPQLPRARSEPLYRPTIVSLISPGSPARPASF